jgi:hypothetical protein
MTTSTFDGWARGTFTKLKRALFNERVEGTAAKVLTDPMLREVFREIDVKHVGMIRTRQLEKALRRCGLDVSRAAVRIVLKELGIDPANGLTAEDFVRFYREAEILTDLARDDRDTHCKTYCLMFAVSSNAVACIVFFWLYDGSVGDERATWLYILIVSGSIFCFFLAYLLSVQVSMMREAGKLPLATTKITVKSSNAPGWMNACQPVSLHARPS